MNLKVIVAAILAIYRHLMYWRSNHLSGWGPMFVEYQDFTVFWHWEVILWVIGLLQHDVRLYISVPYVSMDINLWRKVTSEIHEHWSSMSNDEFTVLWFMFFCRERFCLIQKKSRWQVNRCYQGIIISLNTLTLFYDIFVIEMYLLAKNAVILSYIQSCTK